MADAVEEFELKWEFVDCNGFLTGVVLETSCDECLREEESAHPEDDWGAVVYPVFEEVHSKD